VLPFGKEIGLELGGGGHLSFGVAIWHMKHIYMVLFTSSYKTKLSKTLVCMRWEKHKSTLVDPLERFNIYY
jgi:hypothetical protein